LKREGRSSPTHLKALPPSGVFVVLIAASLLAHGVVLGLPLPQRDAMQEPPPSESAGEAAMDVAILPRGTLAQPTPAAPTPSTTAKDQHPPAAKVPPQADERSPQTVSPRSPVPPAEVPPVPDPSLPPLPEEAPENAPLVDLPIETGTHSPTPPTLDEQLQDATAYQYDGRKALKQTEAYQASTNWVAGGQILPENIAPLELPYQLGEQCLDPPPESGLLAAVLDAEGNFVRGPEVIDSTGYALLDEQAIAIVQADGHVFPDRSEVRGYVTEIVVQ